MTYRRPTRVAFVFGEANLDELHIKILPDGDVHQMEGPAALIWQCAAEGTSNVTAAVARELGLDPSTIAGDVASFLDRLVEMGLLESMTPYDPDAPPAAQDQSSVGDP